jgi:hypothetical protein
MLSFTPDRFVTFTIDFDRFDCENFHTGHGRWQYTTTIVVDGETILTDSTLRSGTTTANNPPPGLGEMLASFLTFLSAFAEAGAASENADLFPASIRETVDAIGADALTTWADDIYPRDR